MVNFAYLYKGLCGLANAHRASPLAGHLGAAVIAGYFLGEDHPDWKPRVHVGIERELDRILRGEESLWFDATKTGLRIAELFEPLPQEHAQEELIEAIPQALSRNIGQTRESGHNVIFAAIALRAVRDHPRYATPSLVAGVRKLIEGFNRGGPGQGYYGVQRGWIKGGVVPLPPDDLPACKDRHAMAEVVVDELTRSAPIRRQGFGGLWHLVNHAAGLAELSLRGHDELARQGLAAHHHHLRLFRSLPDVQQELGPAKRAAYDPRLPDFWTKGTLKRDEARLTHRIKTLYGFFALLQLIEDPAKRRQAEQGLLYLMA